MCVVRCSGQVAAVARKPSVVETDSTRCGRPVSGRHHSGNVDRCQAVSRRRPSQTVQPRG